MPFLFDEALTLNQVEHRSIEENKVMQRPVCWSISLSFYVVQNYFKPDSYRVVHYPPSTIKGTGYREDHAQPGNPH